MDWNSFRTCNKGKGWTRQKMSEEWQKFKEFQKLGDKRSASSVPNGNLDKGATQELDLSWNDFQRQHSRKGWTMKKMSEEWQQFKESRQHGGKVSTSTVRHPAGVPREYLGSGNENYKVKETKPGFSQGPRKPNSWNEFQSAHKGRRWTRKQLSELWKAYKATGCLSTEGSASAAPLAKGRSSSQDSKGHTPLDSGAKPEEKQRRWTPKESKLESRPCYFNHAEETRSDKKTPFADPQEPNAMPAVKRLSAGGTSNGVKGQAALCIERDAASVARPLVGSKTEPVPLQLDEKPVTMPRHAQHGPGSNGPLGIAASQSEQAPEWKAPRSGMCSNGGGGLALRTTRSARAAHRIGPSEWPSWPWSTRMQLRAQRRERVPHDHDRYFKGFSPWLDVTSDNLIRCKESIPSEPGVYEWGARFPNSSNKVTCFYLGKAEHLRRRFNRYTHAGRRHVGPWNEPHKDAFFWALAERGCTFCFRHKTTKPSESVVVELSLLRALDYAANSNLNVGRRKLALDEGGEFPNDDDIQKMREYLQRAAEDNA